MLNCGNIRDRDDAELLAAWLDGDAGAMAVLFSRYSGPLFGYLLKQLRDEDDARDAAQEVWLGLLRWKRLGETAHFNTTLFSFARHVAQAAWRRQLRTQRTREELKRLGGQPLGARTCAKCDKKVQAHGLCNTHYNEEWRKGK